MLTGTLPAQSEAQVKKLKKGKKWQRGLCPSQRSSATFKCCRNFVRRCTYVGFASRHLAQIHIQSFSTICFKPCLDPVTIIMRYYQSLNKCCIQREAQDPCCCELTVLTTAPQFYGGLQGCFFIMWFSFFLHYFFSLTGILALPSAIQLLGHFCEVSLRLQDFWPEWALWHLHCIFI